MNDIDRAAHAGRAQQHRARAFSTRMLLLPYTRCRTACVDVVTDNYVVVLNSATHLVYMMIKHEQRTVISRA